MKPVSHYKTVLEAQLADLDQRAHKIDKSLEETPGADYEDRATERENDEVLQELGYSAIDTGRMIRAALERIEKGTYGVCERCDEQISEERLDILPYTPVCSRCAAGGGD
ncbi:MAG: TraR/DksA family transcriptional regulator [Pseudomonadota bacterium]